MPRTARTDPAMLDRLRQARADEDTALAAISSAQARLDAATARRATVLTDLDAAVENAETELARARAGLVEAAGLDRTALALGLSRLALRRSLPRDTHPGRQAPAERLRPSIETASTPAGGVR